MVLLIYVEFTIIVHLCVVSDWILIRVNTHISLTLKKMSWSLRSEEERVYGIVNRLNHIAPPPESQRASWDTSHTKLFTDHVKQLGNNDFSFKPMFIHNGQF